MRKDRPLTSPSPTADAERRTPVALKAHGPTRLCAFYPGAVPATRTDFQHSRRRFKQAPRTDDVEGAAVPTGFEGTHRQSVQNQRRYGAGIPPATRARRPPASFTTTETLVLRMHITRSRCHHALAHEFAAPWVVHDCLLATSAEAPNSSSPLNYPMMGLLTVVSPSKAAIMVVYRLHGER